MVTNSEGIKTNVIHHAGIGFTAKQREIQTTCHRITGMQGKNIIISRSQRFYLRANAWKATSFYLPLLLSPYQRLLFGV